MSKEVRKIAATLAVRVVGTVDHLNHSYEAHDDDVCDQGRVDVDLDPNDPVVRQHRMSRVFIPDSKIIDCLDDEEGYAEWTRVLRGTRVKGTLMRSTDENIRVVIKISGADRDSDALEGKVVLETTVAAISRCWDIQKLCLPTAGRAYRLLRQALGRGDAAEIDTVKSGLLCRLWQLEGLATCNHEGLREALSEFIAMSDIFFESATSIADPEKAVELIRDLIDGSVTLNEELLVRVQAERARREEEKARKSRSITTVGDMQDERKRVRENERRNKKAAKAQKRATKQAVENDAANVAEVDPNAGEPIDHDEADAGSAEAEAGETGATEAAAETPAPEAPKPKETEKKPEPVVGRDLQSQMMAKLAGIKIPAPAETETAPAADAAPVETE